jgi:hypothetical protein
MIYLVSFFVSMAAHAYIPEYAMMTSRAADQHGKGTYQVDQDVIIRKEAEAFVVRESWLVSGENALRVSFEGRGPLKGLVSGTIVYEGGVKHFYDGSAVRMQKLSDDWLEPLFHFRNSKFFRNRLVSLRIVPPESLKDRAPLPSEGDINYEPAPYVRLSRVGGSIAWAIGASPLNGDAPGVWLEQDQFVLRKFKGANHTVMHADDYSKYDETFWFPRSRTYQFGGFTVQVQTVRVQPVGKMAATDNRFKHSSLASEKDTLKLPDVDGLRDFFQRFR